MKERIFILILLNFEVASYCYNSYTFTWFGTFFFGVISERICNEIKFLYDYIGKSTLGTLQCT